MEEVVGKIWHRFITRTASTTFPDERVELEQVKIPIGMLFRAFGGDGGLRVEPARATDHGGRRQLLQRFAGVDEQVYLAWRDDETLYLPPAIDLFPAIQLNRDLYIWLAAMAAMDSESAESDASWELRQQHLTQSVLQRFPGLERRYRNLLRVILARRLPAEKLPDDESVQEQALIEALHHPGSVQQLPTAKRPLQPLPLWLHPQPPVVDKRTQKTPTPDHDGDDNEQGSSQEVVQKKRQGERVDMPEGDDGLLGFRMEAMLSWAEFINVDRTCDDDEEEDAEKAADSMETLSVARDGKTSKQRLRFDLDLPAAEYDDIPLQADIMLPEWDFKKQRLLTNHCAVQLLEPRDSHNTDLPAHLKGPGRRIRTHFESLAQNKQWQRGQMDGSDLDLDAYQRYCSERERGMASSETPLYRSLQVQQRDLACLLLADLSLSTDAAINNENRVIDVIRDSLHLFTESLAATGDQLALYGFSSRKRRQVRLHQLKHFNEKSGDIVRGRINAIKPGYYTRMGAAIRYASQQLAMRASKQRLLLIITDGKPNDLDQYEGRYGIEDTRVAVQEARKLGLTPFCVTIDKEAGSYLPYLFGNSSYVVISRPEQLPTQLPLLYAKLTS